jgi:hypothetical protein
MGALYLEVPMMSSRYSSKTVFVLGRRFGFHLRNRFNFTLKTERLD